jgi:hypothetical protein
MVFGAHRSYAVFLLFCAACGGGSTTLGVGDDAGSDAGADGSVPSPAPSPTTASCRPGDATAIACNATTEMCIDDYAGVGGFNPHQQCKPLPDPCRDDRSCACVSAHFKCGITTTCSDADGGVVSVTCQPD